MTAQQFWNDEPRLLNSYIKRKEMELDDINYQSWLIGLYVCKAINVTIGNAFSDKSSQKDTYFEKPLGELNSNYKNQNSPENQGNKVSEYRNRTNYWAKLGKKGV